MRTRRYSICAALTDFEEMLRLCNDVGPQTRDCTMAQQQYFVLRICYLAIVLFLSCPARQVSLIIVYGTILRVQSK